MLCDTQNGGATQSPLRRRSSRPTGPSTDRPLDRPAQCGYADGDTPHLPESTALTDPDTLILEVADLDIDVLTGIYSEETHLPQPLRITIRAELAVADRYADDTPLSASKNYMDLKHAATEALPRDRHFTLIEAVAEHIIETVFLQDDKVRAVSVAIVKLAIAERGEKIGITLRRTRR